MVKQKAQQPEDLKRLLNRAQKGKPRTHRRTSSKGVSRKRSSAKRASRQTGLSVWLKYLLAACIILLFAGVFYYFVVRPYAYRWRPCNGYKGYGVCIPCGYEVHGIDISHYQGEVNWRMLSQNKVSDFPLHFIFVKATEGSDLADDRFAGNFDSAHYYGFIRGAYHFFTSQTDAAKQAEFFIRNVKLSAGDLPPVLDVEVKGKRSKAQLQYDVHTWLRKVEAHYGVKPILYTSYKFKTKYLNDSLFNTYPYWIAHYYVDSVQYKGKWHFWQHTDVGLIPGIDEDVDLNVFNGNLEELKRMTLK